MNKYLLIKYNRADRSWLYWNKTLMRWVTQEKDATLYDVYERTEIELNRGIMKGFFVKQRLDNQS
jgi:hypothetical protein